MGARVPAAQCVNFSSVPPTLIMPYQSPISPGLSWYEDTAGPRPEYPRLDGDRRADVVIIGGGFTGLSAAAHLAKSGRRCRADRGASLRRRRLGTQWRPARHRPAQLARRARGRRSAGPAPRRCSTSPRRPRRIFSNSPRSTASRSTSCRASSRSRTRSAMSTTTGRYADYMRERAGYPAYRLHGCRGDRRSGSARRAISAARATPAPATSIR